MPFDVEAVRFYMAELVCPRQFDVFTFSDPVIQLLAIEHVHAHNIVHRDIKPENVFVDTDGHIVLGDFGIACLFDESASTTYTTRGCVGTPAFSSPEVLSGDNYGFEVDLWAFGVMLYEMLSNSVGGLSLLLWFGGSLDHFDHLGGISGQYRFIRRSHLGASLG